MSACNQTSPQSPSVRMLTMQANSMSGQPFDKAIAEFHPEQQAALQAFGATVPATVPQMAFVSSIVINPFIAQPKQPIVQSTDGKVTVPVALVNPGSNQSPRSLLCLRNAVQVSCNSEGDVWQYDAGPQTVAVITATIPVSRNDRLDFVVIPSNEAQRSLPASQIVDVFVDQESAPPSDFIDAPEHQPIFGGCNFIIFIHDPSSTDGSKNMHFKSGTTPIDAPIYLLIQLCEPTGREILRLVPIANQTSMLQIDDPIWQKPIRMTGKAALIKVDVSSLASLQQLQVVAIPLSPEAETAFYHHAFTQAIQFEAKLI